MSDSTTDTKQLLAKHHRDGKAFAELMKETYSNRFNEQFWSDWDKWIAPVFTEQPVVLDLGTGPGLFLKDIVQRDPGMHAIGVEVAPWMLDAMTTLPPNCEIISDDLHDPHLPIEDNSVDAALATVVLHEMHQPVRALQEMLRCLKPGGRFYVMDWVRTPLEVYIQNEFSEDKVFGATTPVSELEDMFIHFVEHNRYSIDDLVYMLEKIGFEVLDKQPIREGRFARLIATKPGKKKN